MTFPCRHWLCLPTCAYPGSQCTLHRSLDVAGVTVCGFWYTGLHRPCSYRSYNVGPEDARKGSRPQEAQAPDEQQASRASPGEPPRTPRDGHTHRQTGTPSELPRTVMATPFLHLI